MSKYIVYFFCLFLMFSSFMFVVIPSQSETYKVEDKPYNKYFIIWTSDIDGDLIEDLYKVFTVESKTTIDTLTEEKLENILRLAFMDFDKLRDSKKFVYDSDSDIELKVPNSFDIRSPEGKSVLFIDFKEHTIKVNSEYTTNEQVNYFLLALQNALPDVCKGVNK